VSLARLADVLARTTGLDASTLGPRALADVLPAGVSPEDEGSVARLAWSLEHDVAARREVRARLLVHETSFFRYPASFAALVREVGRRLAAGAPAVRVLSAACSTGQEPASLAMGLVEAGIPLGRVAIHAFDVSEPAVARAREGRYGDRELAGLEPARRARFFEPAPGGARLVAAIRDALSISVADLLEDDLPGEDAPFDVVLCRNVLIYLTLPARRRALERLDRRLAPDGLLFVGHAEAVALRAHGWVPVEPLEAYAVTRAPHGPSGALLPAPGASVEVRRPPSSARAAPRPWPAPGPRPPSAAPEPVVPPLLVRVRRLAEEGRAAEALALLEADASAPSADALHLAAVLARALERPESVERALTRALYLDPRHAPSLRLAALVAREGGEGERAQRLLGRAERAEAEAAARAGGGE
jgi:chemotaxis protein methyltransferase WspC